MGFRNLLSVGLVGGMMISSCGPEREVSAVQETDFLECTNGEWYENGDLVLGQNLNGEAFFQLHRDRSCSYQILVLDEGVMVSMVVTYQALGIKVTWLNRDGSLVSSQPAMSIYHPDTTTVDWAGISLVSEMVGVDQIVVRYNVDVPRLLKALGFVLELILPEFGLPVKDAG